MKICYVNITTEESTRPYLSLVQKVAEKVRRSDTEVGIKCVSPGLTRGFDGKYAYFTLLNKVEIIEQVLQAEKEGYDAAVVGCFLDPGVREAREVANIPVLGLCETTLHWACLLGHRLGIITVNEPKLIPEFENQIRVYGLESRMIPRPIRTISTPSIEVFTRGMEDPKSITGDILEQAHLCLKDGAEVIVVGCNGLGPLCTVAGLTKVEGSGAPILDCVAVTLKMAEVMVELGNSTGIPFVSRVGMYDAPRQKDMKRVRTIFGLKS